MAKRNSGEVRADVAEEAMIAEPMYFTDDAGCLCVMMPDGYERRLTDVEIEALTQ